MHYRAIIFACIFLLFSSCGFNIGSINSLNNTQVILDEPNYIYIGSATGEASSNWFFGLGPIGNDALVQKAKENLVGKVDLYNGSRALVNMTVDYKISMVTPIFIKKTAYISADIIEFSY